MPLLPTDEMRAQLLAAYDDQLRTDAETPSALEVSRLGPLRLVIFAGGRGFVTYRDLGGADQAGIGELVRDALAFFTVRDDVDRVEWKTRGHDHAPGLHEALTGAGFVAEEPESIMIGATSALIAEVPLPDGIRIRRITEEADISAMEAMQGEVFGEPSSPAGADAVLRRLAIDPSMELWVAESGDEIVCAGRLEPVPDSDFAGIWGGATRPEWRGRGIYRALTSARAASALRLGKRLINSDSTEFSRPILERSGLIKVSTTTPYTWRRRAGAVRTDPKT